MDTIWKYDIKPDVTHHMPAGAKFLSLGMQGEDAVMWFLVNTDNDLHPRKFRVFGTGWEIYAVDRLVYKGTFFPQEGLVFHLFEVM